MEAETEEEALREFESWNSVEEEDVTKAVEITPRERDQIVFVNEPEMIDADRLQEALDVLAAADRVAESFRRNPETASSSFFSEMERATAYCYAEEFVHAVHLAMSEEEISALAGTPPMVEWLGSGNEESVRALEVFRRFERGEPLAREA